MSSDTAATLEAEGDMLRTTGCRLVCGFLYDSHCHLRRVPPGVPAVSVSSPVASVNCAGRQCDDARCGVAGLVLCGTHPSIDWDAVAQASTMRAATLIGFGVHPWFVPNKVGDENPASSLFRENSSGETCCCRSRSSAEANANRAACGAAAQSLSDILRLLEERLQQHPSAIVAEIGLDKLRGPPESVQVEAFAAQLRLASAYRRPVSVHCVRHHGLLLRVLQDLPAEHTPPAIILHAFTGSLEVAKSLLSLKSKKRRPAADGSATPAQDAAATAGSGTAAQRTTKRGGTTSDTVRIKDLIFFGVGVSTSFAVKNFSTQTLPFLLDARRVLLETDEHYSGIEALAAASAGGFPAEAEAQSSVRGGARACVCVDPQEHVTKLSGVMERIHASMLQNREFVQKAEASSMSVESALQDTLMHAYAAAFRSVSEKTGPS
ncbi:conserved hypothetical protein [Leishmania infantum JPCM5]|uniref:TatD_related_DNase_-_putative n=2 Tax=Leishmania infantum TaxID=5671 RepID=A0A6L0XSM5_LEIIN|nr:conserved hypothetical protein [Leishmania infantum JPCM5]CAC9551615.1 TatD_related_DNase_-_putative [Leishmania infantum]CAM72719.1 conserved hypothetical protein [Leishmania infantum JPCM5]SUZ46805.1 TatD_related_DNase_-_putative [Leishmania infantum]|eukprot:XP_001469609.1 conserved hypothetical protein [Leishmania infantum JPCM5]